MNDCLFCKISQQRDFDLIAEDDSCLAFLDINPVSKGHALIITKKHFEDITKLDEEGWNSIFPIFGKVISKLNKRFKPQGFNVISNVGSIAYQSVFHFHLHIIPKYKTNEGFIWTVRNNLSKKRR